MGSGTIFSFDKLDEQPKSTADNANAGEQNNLGGQLLSEQIPMVQAAYHTRGHHPAPHHHRAHQDAPSPRHHRGTDVPAHPAHTAHPAAASDAGKDKKTKIENRVDHFTNPAPEKQLSSFSGFTNAMNSYWQRLTHARKNHEFLQAFPPVWNGMDAPHKTPPPVVLAPESIKGHGSLPSLNDLYSASKNLNRIVTHDKTAPDFHTLDLPEGAFKKRYAEEAVHVGKDYGLNKVTMANLVKRIYAFEGGGWSTYNTLSSMPQELMNDDQKDARGKFHPASTAIGYNQLLLKDTVNDIAKHGDVIAGRLNELAVEQPARAGILHEKAKLVSEMQDVLLHRASPDIKVPADKHKRFNAPSSTIEKAVHSFNLDGDIGPVIQSQELNNLLKYAKDNKFGDYLNTRTALETSHAAEYDKLTPPQKAAAAEQLLSMVRSADLDPTKPEQAAAFNATKESLRRKFLTLTHEGAVSSIEREHLSADEFKMMNSQILTIRRYGGENGPLSPEARAMLDRVTFDYFGGYSADRLQAAAIELANLAGMGSASMMLNPDNGNLPTSNFFARPGYVGNPVTSRRSANELLLQIYRIMHGPNSDPNKPGMKQFNDAFNSIPDQQISRR